MLIVPSHKAGDEFNSFLIWYDACPGMVKVESPSEDVVAAIVAYLAEHNDTSYLGLFVHFT